MAVPDKTVPYGTSQGYNLVFSRSAWPRSAGSHRGGRSCTRRIMVSFFRVKPRMLSDLERVEPCPLSVVAWPAVSAADEADVGPLFLATLGAGLPFFFPQTSGTAAAMWEILGHCRTHQIQQLLETFASPQTPLRMKVAFSASFYQKTSFNFSRKFFLSKICKIDIPAKFVQKVL